MTRRHGWPIRTYVKSARKEEGGKDRGRGEVGEGEDHNDGGQEGIECGGREIAEGGGAGGSVDFGEGDSVQFTIFVTSAIAECNIYN